MDAVLDAAAELLVEVGPHAATVRAIAERAGVNHALVHRYFGTKEDLVRAVLVREADRFESLLVEGMTPDLTLGRLYHELAGRRIFVRFLARTILDGLRPERLHQDRRLLQRMVEVVAEGERLRGGGLDPRMLLAGMSAMALGWCLFDEYLVAGMGLADLSRGTVDEEIGRIIQLMLTAAGATATDVTRAP
jgi:AcrR family transcriptional regulator